MDDQGNQRLELYQNFVALVNDLYTVGLTTRTERESEELPRLPEGYTWEEQSRVSGAGTLIPIFGGSFKQSKDRVTYVLQKSHADLPDSFEVPRVVSGFARSKSEFVNGLTCGGSLSDNRGDSN